MLLERVVTQECIFSLLHHLSGWELSVRGQKKTLNRMFFPNEIQGGLGPEVCCPKTIVQATSKMKNRFKQGYLDKAAPKKTRYNKVDGGGACECLSS